MPLPTLAASVFALFCINASQADMDQSVKNLKVVDAALEVNDLDKARKWLDWVYGYLHDANRPLGPDGKLHLPEGVTADPPPPGLVRRAARARALLLSRDPKSTPAQREDAKKIYERQVLGAKPDPAMQADYGEILARIPAQAATATTMLRTLRDKDLMGSAQAYAALADLEKAAGDGAAEASARDKCKTRTKVPAICDAH
jgi:hypothetical protein